jgi:microcystin-dependent protein
MPTLAVTKNYADNEILFESDLDTAFESIETFINSTKLGNDNLQANSVDTAQIANNSVSTNKIANDAITTVKILDAQVTLAKIAADIVAKLVPTGSVTAYTGTSAPTGWLLCDGSQVSRVSYADLFAVISTSHGIGDASTTFNLPDYRGRFMRMTDGAAGRDPDSATRTAMNTGGNTGNAVGSVQSHALASHTHTTDVANGLYSLQGPASSIDVARSGGNNTGSTGGAETRPVNAYVNYIIKI